MCTSRKGFVSVLGTAGLVALVAALATILGTVPADAQQRTPISIKVGRTVGGSGFHIPSYVAVEKGQFLEEGLKATLIAMEGGALVKANIAKEIDFQPIVAGGSQALLAGAPLIYIVGESTISQWTITTTPDIKKVEDLKGKVLGLGRPGSADYEELVITLQKFFKMEPGKDYKVIAFRGEPDRVAALLKGSIQGAALSFPHAARAEIEGFKILVKTGEYIPRLGGTFMTHRDYVTQRRDLVKAFIKAIAKSIDYIRTNKAGTCEVIQKYFGIDDRRVVESIYTLLHDKYSPEIPHNLLLQLFQSRAIPELGWPAGKPLPDIEQFVARSVLNEALGELGKKPSK
ncbi:MAG: ABC transporter substrate-binding protein [Deltaproteobacteria bacterium]|nr:ABC transporter substrate-binding protein [Deltaproteobacteria bacterium]